MTMYASYVSYFNLIMPVTTLLLGVLLIASWAVLRTRDELLWIAAGYIMPAFVLAAQSGMSNEDLAFWSVFTAPLFIGGAWCIGNGIARRYNTRSHPLIALVIGVIATSLLFYFSRIDHNLWLRVLILNSAILLAQTLALPSALRSPKITSIWDRLLLWSFVLFSFLIFCRIIVIMSSDPMTNTALLTQSPYWRFLLTSSLFFSLWFVIILLGTTLSSILHNLTYDRDHDPLTGLYNRRAFFEQTQKHLARSRRGPCCILALDIDHFKTVNDTYGHDIGDAVLKHVAKILDRHTGGQHILSRFGGEEFILLLRDCQIVQAKALAQEIQQHLRELDFKNGPTSITASFGLAAVEDMAGLAEALKQADRALYVAKSNGRDQIRLANMLIHSA